MFAGTTSTPDWELDARERHVVARAAAARECRSLELADTLGLTLLLLDARDDRFEPAATRWLGQFLRERPALGLTGSEKAAKALRDLNGASPDVAVASLAFLVRNAGADDAARVLEKWLA